MHKSHNIGGKRKRWLLLLLEIPPELDLSIENDEKCHGVQICHSLTMITKGRWESVTRRFPGDSRGVWSGSGT